MLNRNYSDKCWHDSGSSKCLRELPIRLAVSVISYVLNRMYVEKSLPACLLEAKKGLISGNMLFQITALDLFDI